ncbi:MAG TPA: serine--tRNA ligase [Rhizomicrobium sp.]|nr:serine--tRNA ligase [Rhizomicrobium sp.]
MHDIRAIRDNPDAFVAGLKRRGLADASAIAEDVLAKDRDLRALLTRLQEMQARRNEASKLIGQAKAKRDEAQASASMEEVAKLKGDIQNGEVEERDRKEALDYILAGIPNIPADDVPDGENENNNVEVTTRAYGSRPTMNTAKEHFDLGEALGLMDFERAAKVSGARFVYLKGALAKLERALGSFMLDIHTEKFGYTEIQPPLLVRTPAMFGTGQLPKFSDDLYYSSQREQTINHLVAVLAVVSNTNRELFSRVLDLSSVDGQHDEIALQNVEIAEIAEEAWARLEADADRMHWLIPTAEVPLTNYVREEILDESQLPMRFTAWTPCFRAEAGAAGKDTRGMIRQHQFSKVELVSITTPEQSDAEHERMTDCAQEILRRLDLHHRVMTLCTGDMGFSAKKTYDIEVWLPGQNRFREISSCSNCGEFQARRMNTRYRGKDGKVKGPVHTLNGSGLAVGRTLIAIMENYQNSDGSIAIPDALRPYMGGMERIAK